MSIPSSQQRRGHDVNLEVFVSRQLDVISKEAASGRSKEHKELQERCKELNGEPAHSPIARDHPRPVANPAAACPPPADFFTVEEFGKPGSHISVPFAGDVTDRLVALLRLTFSLNNPRLTEPALSCLHKLVAYAYLQGESRPSGRTDDATNLVVQVVGMASRCGDATSPAVQLAVVRGLLTFATADHFQPHGDCLMQAVRTVFNLAVGGANADAQNTARSALLQMVNTILKRVAHQVVVSIILTWSVVVALAWFVGRLVGWLLKVGE